MQRMKIIEHAAAIENDANKISGPYAPSRVNRQLTQSASLLLKIATPRCT